MNKDLVYPWLCISGIINCFMSCGGMKSKLSFSQLLLWLFCITFFVYQYGIRSAVPNVFNEDLRNYFSIHTTEMGTLISLFYVAYTAMQIPVGLVIDRFSAKLISVFAFVCVSLGTIMFVITNNYMIAAMAQLFLGFGCSFAFVLIMKITHDVFPPQKVAFFSSLAISCGSLGPIIMSPLLAHLSQIHYWKNIVLLFGCVGFVLAVLGYVLIKGSGSNHQTVEHPDIMSSVKSAMSNPQYFCIGVFSMLMLGPVSAFCDAWGLTFIRNVYNLDKVHAASVVSVVYLGTILGGPLVAYIAERVNSYKKVMMAGSVLLLFFFGVVILFKLNLYVLYVWLFMIGVISACQFLSFPAIMSVAPKKMEGTLTGVANTITMMGGTVLVPLVGIATDFFKDSGAAYSANDYKNGMLVLLVSIASAVISTFFIKDRPVAR